jgi:4-amino-4-deoxy-L-arabinose transferase-like glycosyltransferase
MISWSLQHPRQSFYRFLLSTFLLRSLFILILAPLTNLVGDEAYYWDWGRHPDWGYYSKPPLIGWIMGAIGNLSHHSELTIRFTALILGTAVLIFLFEWLYRAASPLTALISVVLISLTPGNIALNFFLTIDALLIFFWSLCFWLSWSLTQNKSTWFHYCGYTLALGLGLLSKQMMIVFPLIHIVHLAIQPELRPILKKPAYWISTFLALLFLIPVLIWNSDHHWVAAHHTASHFESQTVTWTKWLSRTLEFPISQLFIYSPLFLIAASISLFKSLRSWKSLSLLEKQLFLFSAPAWIIFIFLGFRQRINPNWPAVFILPGLLLASIQFCRTLTSSSLSLSSQLKKVSFSSAIIVGVLYLFLPLFLISPLSKPKKMQDLIGWDSIGQQLDDSYSQLSRQDPNLPVLALGHRYHAALSAFYISAHPQTFRYENSLIPQSQYELWSGLETYLHQNILILQPLDSTNIPPLPSELTSRFTSIEPIPNPNSKFQLYLGKNLLSWPPYSSNLIAR